MDKDADPGVASKIQKAREFLEAASLLADSSHNASVSLSASAAINASDALILFNTGSYPTGSEHTRAVTVLRKVVDNNAAIQLSRALLYKTKAQYALGTCSLAEAESALKSAERLVQKCENLI
ncbi:HEPN domain-containing protein [Clavibacter michiganensis]|uniref:HEPN domain-containing protein n=1 Tax=Clavibacter michiganensis TaxID=28447 RepID=UPI0026DDAFE5|nr:HEPN domain-containing protein [Clavibacter michiganensis]MDO4027059.1 HEPN domain-containing protein [Clavibacter michiganensis]MDO4035021.1 HEPN domain-containing protein [Clavibacter michiganensis]MDO4048591.1 HEPN domain-containing protein [Clavibacter michiganensis]MDO4107071.1 HEPN domain-containing protein [Clavibacter michiganensis]MDO4132031.1 HEPN domain-containing protein [Clavibacter michiganensis]